MVKALDGSQNQIVLECPLAVRRSKECAVGRHHKRCPLKAGLASEAFCVFQEKLKRGKG